MGGLSQPAGTRVIGAYDHWMQAVVYGIPNCDTVKKARSWLDGRGIGYRFHDFKKDGVPPDRLEAWCDRLGWEPLVNRKGTTWRKLDAQAQAAVADASSARALMKAQPSVIKRPVVEWQDGTTTVGFDVREWERRVT
jgi:Spx/MgsR family transcriptional regulator